jgi:flagellar biosynthesis protein FlhF
LRVKSYFAASVEAAVDKARQEMGPEAMILQSRATGPEARRLGAYEVVVGSAEGSGPERDAEPAGTNANGVADRFAAEVAELRRQLDGMRRAIARSGLAAPRWLLPSSAWSEAFSALVAADVSGDLAQEMVESVHAGGAGPGDWRRALAREMASRFQVSPVLGRGPAGPRAVALVGPPGAGKTTTLVKLALSQGISQRRPVQVFSADTYRVAAAEQLRSYTAILGVAFQVFETIGALAQALGTARDKELILIDTPGYGFADMEDSADLARWLGSRPDIETHLVLTASMKSADLMRVVDAYETFKPQRLLFTRLDETESFGPVFGEAVRLGRPLSFFGTGQRIPEDLAAASKDLVVNLILDGRADALSPAA